MEEINIVEKVFPAGVCLPVTNSVAEMTFFNKSANGSSRLIHFQLLSRGPGLYIAFRNIKPQYRDCSGKFKHERSSHSFYALSPPARKLYTYPCQANVWLAMRHHGCGSGNCWLAAVARGQQSTSTTSGTAPKSIRPRRTEAIWIFPESFSSWRVNSQCSTIEMKDGQGASKLIMVINWGY